MIELHRWLEFTLELDQEAGADRSPVAGYELDPAQLLPHLDLTVRTTSLKWRHQPEPMVWRTVALDHPGKGRLFSVTLMVAQQHCLHARHALLESYLPTALEPALIKGEMAKVDIGDFCLLSARDPTAARIDFVRRNVAVRLRAAGDSNQADVLDLARRLDAALDHAPALDRVDPDPRPAEGILQASRYEVRPGGRVDLSLPESPLEVHQAVELDPESCGSLNRAPGDGLYYRAGPRAGEQQIHLHRVNARNLLHTTTVKLEVL